MRDPALSDFDDDALKAAGAKAFARGDLAAVKRYADELAARAQATGAEVIDLAARRRERP